MDSEELEEKDFIQEGYKKDPSTLWLFLGIFLVILGLLWFLGVWGQYLFNERRDQDPFLQVTNREFSLFLWQHPQYMRANQRGEVGYLPDFHSDDDVRVTPYFADALVAVPDEVLFLYHVWRRLLYDSVFIQAIDPYEFEAFLQSCQEWLPPNWKKAPASYIALLKGLSEEKGPVAVGRFPHEVALAFQGWKNYYFQREKITHLLPSKELLGAFLQKYPNYGRSYFRNLFPDYLLSKVDKDKELSLNEMTYFLQVALYNGSTTTNPSS